MSTGKRNRAWPLAIALSVAVVGVLAAFIVMAVQEPVPAAAHGPNICHTPFGVVSPECAAEHPHTDGTDGTNGTDTDTNGTNGTNGNGMTTRLLAPCSKAAALRVARASSSR